MLESQASTYHTPDSLAPQLLRSWNAVRGREKGRVHEIALVRWGKVRRGKDTRLFERQPNIMMVFISVTCCLEGVTHCHIIFSIDCSCFLTKWSGSGSINVQTTNLTYYVGKIWEIPVNRFSASAYFQIVSDDIYCHPTTVNEYGEALTSFVNVLTSWLSIG